MSSTRKFLPKWVKEGMISSSHPTQIEQWLDARTVDDLPVFELSFPRDVIDERIC